MLRTIEKHNGVAIQKVTKLDGTLLRYQVIREELIGKDTASFFDTLTEARRAAGAILTPAEKELTRPKASYPQNQKGYKAPAR